MARVPIPAWAIVLAAQMLVATPATARQEPGPGPKPNRDPEAAALVFSDIARFWQAYDDPGPRDRADVLRDDYLGRGSVGLEEFARVRIGDARDLAAAIAKHPNYYASLRGPTGRMARHEAAIRANFRKLAALYEPAVFPDVYFVIGRMNSGGTLTDKGLLIGAEMYGLAGDTPREELGAWHRAVLRPVETIPVIVAHELVHYQQKYPRGAATSTLLGMALMEGGADFVGELISGGTINRHLHEYGDPRERDLWAEFARGMDGTDLGQWLFQGDRARDRPADLGYYIGYKICQSYYEDAADKPAAVRAILEIADFKEFLAASRYESKLARRPR